MAVQSQKVVSKRLVTLGPWLLAALATLIAVVVAHALVPGMYPTNDDALVQQALAGGGGVSAEPTPYVSFVNFALCRVISWLFCLVPQVPWWLLLELVASHAAVFSVGWVLASWARRRSPAPSLPVQVLVLSCVEFGLFASLMTRVQFTQTSALLVAAGILVSCTLLWPESRGRRGILAWSVALAVMGYAVRPQTGYVGFFFWLLTVGVVLASQARGGMGERLVHMRPLVTAVALSGAVGVALLAIHTAAWSGPEHQAELRFGAALARYTDYPIVPYEEDPARYEEAGWDEELAGLVHNWFTMDERVTAEALERVSEGNMTWLTELLDDPAGTLKTRLSELVNPYPASIMAILFVSGGLAMARSRTRGERALVWVVSLAVCALLGYLLLRGRLPERAMLTVVLPALAGLTGLRMLDGPGAGDSPGHAKDVDTAAGERRPTCPALAHMTICFLACCMLALVVRGEGVVPTALAALVSAGLLARAARGRDAASTGPGWPSAPVSVLLVALLTLPGVVFASGYSWLNPGNDTLYRVMVPNTARLYDYMEDHGDEIFLVDGAAPIAETSMWVTDWPSNQTGWGGWRDQFLWHDKAMRELGLDGRMMADDLFRENVRYVSDENGVDATLLSYLEKRFGDVEVTLVDEVGEGVCVYQLVLVK